MITLVILIVLVALFQLYPKRYHTEPNTVIEVVEIEVVRYMHKSYYENNLEAEIIYWTNKYNQLTDMPGFTYFGEFVITGYCSCELCTGRYALNRPWVGNREIAITASGAVAEIGITIATDPSVIPIGTVLYIDGLGIRVAQDIGGAVRGRHIDVFFGSHSGAHQEALEWGRRYRVVWIVESPTR